MEKLIEKTSVLGLIALHWISLILAFVLITTSSYIMWDMWHTERSAFSSYDLTQYRPIVEQGEPASLEEVKKVNKDARAWLTMYGTHIDYPVLQGKNDLEYVNKNIHGETTPTGSIYEASKSNSKFKDPYTLLYGHHVDSGAMFGDVSKYLKKAYFSGHRKGILITDGKVYDLTVFAAMSTDAYDYLVYNPSNVVDVNDSLLPYIKRKATIFDSSVTSIMKIIAFSTCDDYSTNGRTVVFAKMEEHKGKYEPYDIDESGIPMAFRREKYWAFLNLICLIFTGYNFLPLHVLKSKYRRNKAMKKRNKAFDSDEYEDMPEEVTLFYETKKFGKLYKFGVVGEILAFIVALIVFILDAAFLSVDRNSCPVTNLFISSCQCVVHSGLTTIRITC